jgi:ribosomal protein S6--L-glutamate ligase
MKIALLARNPHLYSHRRLSEAARARGHDIEIINTLRVSINITSRKPAPYYRKRALDTFDTVIPRIGASVTFYGLAVLRQFEVMGIYPLNESVAIGRSRDKLRCLQLLARRGIGLPVTAFTHDPRQAEDIIDLVGGPPVVIKLLEGTQGIGVVLGETVKSAKSVIEAFQGHDRVPRAQRGPEQHPNQGQRLTSRPFFPQATRLRQESQPRGMFLR